MPAICLTDEQNTIVNAPPGHYVITAVAGSGKTTTLAHRIRYLLEQGYDSKRILILMFNRAARQDFSKQLAEVAANHSRPEVRTFHAMGYRLYQRFIREGYLPQFNQQILSEKEIHFQIWRILNKILQDDALREAKKNKKEHVEIGYQFIETVKNGIQTPKVVLSSLKMETRFDYLLALFDHYEQWRKQSARISYTDMLYDPVMAIVEQPQLENIVKNKMDILLVDEYQDTNDIQHELLKRIAGTRAKITVVGDPDQTIYEFRGANPDYIIKGFAQEFPDATPLNLSYSFRYGHTVSLLANHLISQNKGRVGLLCRSHSSTPQTKVLRHECRDETQGVIEILKAISQPELRQCAILARVWSQTVGIELALLENLIPYQIDGHRGVFSLTETRSLRGILEISSQDFRQFSPEQRKHKLDLLFHFPHVGLPDTQIKAICANLSQFDDNWGHQLQEMIPADLNKIQSIKLKRLGRALVKVEKQPRPVKQILMDYIDDTDLYEGIRSLSLSHDHAEEKISTLKGVARFVSQRQGDAREVLHHLDQLEDNAKYLSLKQSDNRSEGAIHLTTIHRAKGLEWETVLIPGLNDRTIPYSYRSDTIGHAQLESERRLLYVAMTRAVSTLHLFVPKNQDNQPIACSRFEYELNFEQSMGLANAINDGSNNFETLDSDRISKITERYSEEMGCTIVKQVSKSSDNAQSSSFSEKNKPVWFSHRVAHCVLGEGQVTSEQNGSFSVQFGDDQNRTFSKETAERFFTPIG